MIEKYKDNDIFYLFSKNMMFRDSRLNYILYYTYLKHDMAYI